MVANNAWFLETITLHPFQIHHEISIIMESMAFLILSRLRASFVHHSSTDVSYWPKWLDIYCINFIKLRPPSKFEWWNDNCIVCDLLDLADDCKKRIFTTILPISTVKTIRYPNSILHHQPLKKTCIWGKAGSPRLPNWCVERSGDDTPKLHLVGRFYGVGSITC
jgi:hypothetical protein